MSETSRRPCQACKKRNSRDQVTGGIRSASRVRASRDAIARHPSVDKRKFHLRFGTEELTRPQTEQTCGRPCRRKKETPPNRPPSSLTALKEETQCIGVQDHRHSLEQHTREAGLLACCRGGGSPKLHLSAGHTLIPTMKACALAGPTAHRRDMATIRRTSAGIEARRAQRNLTNRGAMDRPPTMTGGKLCGREKPRSRRSQQPCRQLIGDPRCAIAARSAARSPNKNRSQCRLPGTADSGSVCHKSTPNKRRIEADGILQGPVRRTAARGRRRSSPSAVPQRVRKAAYITFQHPVMSDLRWSGGWPVLFGFATGEDQRFSVAV